jgi:hypothetical protein
MVSNSAINQRSTAENCLLNVQNYTEHFVYKGVIYSDKMNTPSGCKGVFNIL